MCIVESLKLKRYGYMGLASARPIDVQISSLVTYIILFEKSTTVYHCLLGGQS